jgi:hypothetical protein
MTGDLLRSISRRWVGAGAVPSNFNIMFVADFELKEAYIDGAKAARRGLSLIDNPFEDSAKRANWATGHRTASIGRSEPVSYLRIRKSASYRIPAVCASTVGTETEPVKRQDMRWPSRRPQHAKPQEP